MVWVGAISAASLILTVAALTTRHARGKRDLAFVLAGAAFVLAATAVMIAIKEIIL
jgi:hypothetical protein